MFYIFRMKFILIVVLLIVVADSFKLKAVPCLKKEKMTPTRQNNMKNFFRICLMQGMFFRVCERN